MPDNDFNTMIYNGYKTHLDIEQPSRIILFLSIAIKKTNRLPGTSLIEQPDQFGGLDKFGGHDQRH